MTRLLALATGALLLLAGCGNTEEPPPRSDCDFEDLNLAACEPASLDALQAEGVWNMDLLFSDGEHAPGVIRFSGQPHVSGLPITSQRVEPGVFLLSSDVETVTDRIPVRYLFAGCRAPSPTQVQGVFRRCTNGTNDLEGTFEAARVVRRPGEDEASQVQLVSETALPRGQARDVFVAGGHAYVAASEEGVFIYNVSEPTEQCPSASPEAPCKVAELKPGTGDAWTQVWVREQTLYIASALKGVVVYDVSSPAEPRSPKAFPGTAVEVTSLAFEGSWLYAASPYPNAEVLIFDATQPRELTLAKRYFDAQANPLVGARPWGVAAREGRLYVSHGTYGLLVLDMSNPRQPQSLGRYSYTGADSRKVGVGAVGSQTLAFEAGEFWGAHLRVLDVSDPQSLITQRGEFSLRPEVSLAALELVGTKLYMAHYQDGLRILNVANPSTLAPLGYYNTWRETDGGRGNSFFEGLSDVHVPGDGYIYGAETARGLMIFREQP